MAKVQILAVLTMDGCLSELESKKHDSGTSDTYGIEAIREKTYFKITPEYSISMLAKWREQKDKAIYLAEATPRTADFINGMLRMRVVDEIILYTLPQIAGTGRHFFQSALPQDEWKVLEHKLYDGGVVFTVYRTEWKPTVFIK
ncbi:dihydrofolate reductase family protein [Parabacteroides johnsonii]|nr:dihydrofolate reductase family protein [Parabacteroides johnsonii]